MGNLNPKPIAENEARIQKLLMTDKALGHEVSLRFDALQKLSLLGAYHCLGYFHTQMKNQQREGRSESGGHFQVDRKSDRTFVTTADREAEEILRQQIAKDFAHDTIVGEEFGRTEGKSGWCWYLDPIDGTQAFVHGVPLFGTLVGVEYQGVSILGAVVLPALGEALFAAKNQGCHWHRGLVADPKARTFLGGERSLARVSPVKDMGEALFCTTWLKSYQATNTVGLFYKICEKTGIFRGWGDCYGYALVATGRAEIMVDPQLMVWDAAPMLVLIEEAGGRYTSLNGERSIHSSHAIATNGWLHDRVLELAEAFPVMQDP
jgi:histidinol-phosphatase